LHTLLNYRGGYLQYQ